MSRTQDEKLRDRILDVAVTLLSMNGEQGVTMRAVAQAANTTTPTVYSRFPDKEALLLALAARERDRYVVRQSRRKMSLEDAARSYLEWAVSHRYEYRLIHGELWPHVLSVPSGRLNGKWVQQQLAARFGGHADDYESVSAALWLVLHGTASLLTQQPTGPEAKYVRHLCLTACDRIIKSARLLRR